MEPEGQKVISKIVDFLKDIQYYRIKDDKKDDLKLYAEDDIKSIEDYASLTTIKSLKQNPEYYLSKWNIIINNLISLENYFYYLEKETKNENKNSQSINMISQNSNEITSDEEDTSDNQEKNINNIIDQINFKDNQNKKINEFKLNYMKKYMKISSLDIIEGEDFEKYVKKTFNLMLLLLKIDYYDFLHPKEVHYKNLLNINNNIPEENSPPNFEIDLVINGFYQTDLQKLLDNFPNLFFLKSNLD